MISNNNHWKWPKKLDALPTDSEHHKLLLENEFAHAIHPLIITHVHTHQHSATHMIKAATIK